MGHQARAVIVVVLTGLCVAALSVTVGLSVAVAQTVPPGSLQWAWHVGGYGLDDDSFVAVTTSASGAAYAAGHIYGSASYKSQAAVAKYSPGGRKLWLRLYGGSGWDTFAAVARDGQGNVYAAGTSLGTGTSTFITAKYSASGQRLWARSYAYADNEGNRAVALAVDGAGNCYVTGAVLLAPGRTGWATVKYDTGGRQRWVALYTPPAPGGAPAAIAVDRAGNPYVTGTGYVRLSGGAAGFAQGAVTISYVGGGSSAGQQRWLSRRPASRGGWSVVRAVAVRDGSVTVAGYDEFASAPAHVGFVTRYVAADGTLQWSRGWKGPLGDTSFTAMVVDGSGNTFVAGSYLATLTNRNGMVLKFGPTGKVLWAGTVDWGGTDLLRCMARGAYGDLIVSGRSGAKLSTALFSSAGKLVWARLYKAKTDTSDAAWSVAVDSNEAVYVAGYGALRGEHTAALLLKYRP